MSKRGKNYALAVLSLTLGGLLYILFRPNTYLAVFCSNIPVVSYMQSLLADVHIPFFAYYFVDFLWGLSLCSGLIALHNPEIKGKIGCAAVALAWGSLWELLQRLDVVGGTGDWMDVFMYLLAAFVGLII